jgi:hypothetical protein
MAKKGVKRCAPEELLVGLSPKSTNWLHSCVN